jgi:hypothetical protein
MRASRRAPTPRAARRASRPRATEKRAHTRVRRVAARAKRDDSLAEITPEALKKQLFASKDLWSTDVHAVMCRHCDGANAAKYWLQYMPMRNRAEVIRLMLELAQAPHAVEVVGYLAWPKVKPTTPFGKTPSLVDIDGCANDVSHETAIIRYLGRELSLDGANEYERARVDELFMQYWHTIRNGGLTHDGQLYSARALKDATRVDVECARFQETHRVNDLSVPARSAQALRVFEEILERNGNSRLVGESLTYVDLALFETLFELAEEDLVPDFATRLNLPRCGEFLTAVAREPPIDRYLKSATRIPRYERPTYAYIGGRHCAVP